MKIKNFSEFNFKEVKKWHRFESVLSMGIIVPTESVFYENDKNI